MSTPLTPREKIARLRALYLEQLPQRLVEAQCCVTALQQAADPEQATTLHRILHGFKGSGRSFGFKQLGMLAEQAETLTRNRTGEPITPDWPAIEQVLTAMSQEIQRLCAPTAALESSDDALGFSMPSSTGSSNRSIYLCDAEADLLSQLADQLACFGYRCQQFTDAHQLEQAVRQQRPDALIIDIDFPASPSSGPHLLQRLQQTTQQPIPTLFLSNRDDFEARLQAVLAGGDYYFKKPAAVMALVAALDQLTCQRQRQPYRVLLLDDEPEVAGYHAVLLQEAGMVTEQISLPNQVLPALHEFRPDIVLMDLYAPQCNGRDLAKLIRQMPDFVALPIVYLSSETDRGKQFMAMEVGAEDFLTKPVAPAELVAAVSIRAERMRTLRDLMARDSLTGLFNHTTTSQLLNTTMASARRGGGGVCFAMIDLDHFKQVNDSYGHPVGDQVILALSRLLQQRLRQSDIIGRYGGEEFAIILQDTSLAAAAKLLDTLRDDFARIRFHREQLSFGSTFSAGLACQLHYGQPETLREAADQALYRAKHAGRNRVEVDWGEG